MSATPAPPDAPAVPPHALGYRALKLWQRALDLAVDAHRLARTLPEADQPTLAADLRRVAATVPAAIAASALAFDTPGRQHALQLTSAALARLETLAAVAERLGALPSADVTTLLFTAGDVNRLLRGFVRSVAARTATPRAQPAVAPQTPALAVAERPAAREDAAPAATATVTPEPAQAPAPADPPPSMRTTRRRAPSRTATRPTN